MSVCDLSVRIGSLELRNPVLSASGTYGHGLEMEPFTAPDALGAWVSKTVTPKPRGGNAAPRICETEAGLLNSIGLENRGVEHYLAHTLPAIARSGAVVVTNVGGESVEEFVEMVRIMDAQAAVHAIEVNLSCPNVQGGRLPFATDPAAAARVIGAARAAARKPLFAKLSPNTAHIGEIARAVEAAGADAITAVNTLLGLAVDWRTRRPGLATVQGGYSGPGIKPVALRCAWECARSVAIPVIGCGGIQDAEDALEYLVAGCTAVQVGTSSFADPALPGRIAADMRHLLEAAGVARVSELVGTIHDGREGRAPGDARPAPVHRSPR